MRTKPCARFGSSEPSLRCLCPQRALFAQLPTNRPLRIIAFGAHPDDAESQVRGDGRELRARRAPYVKLVSVTNGDIGHFAQAGGPLAQRRKAEVEVCHAKLGLQTEVLDIHDGELMPTSRRARLTGLIREWKADIVLSHRPNDYHPDHRSVGQLVQDASLMVTVPFFTLYAPPTLINPVFLYYSDKFRKPYLFRPDSCRRFRRGCAEEMGLHLVDCPRSSATRIRGRPARARTCRPTKRAARRSSTTW